ncbi:hypothetical protein BDQ17DRAFT_521571 [Cyathus striatus]|nr:hypothetical protein BDQ17DRAFT_521571 [Cyathus striatus]
MYKNRTATGQNTTFVEFFYYSIVVNGALLYRQLNSYVVSYASYERLNLLTRMLIRRCQNHLRTFDLNDKKIIQDVKVCSGRPFLYCQFTVLPLVISTYIHFLVY